MRTNLKVPYAEKDQAKRLGAKWDWELKTWYVMNAQNLDLFVKWLPIAQAHAPAAKPATSTKFRESIGKTVVGNHFFEHDCCCLPWEDCACGAMVARPAAVNS